MASRTPVLLAVGLVASFALGACGSGNAFEASPTDVPTVCTPLERTACACEGGHDGQRSCRDDGTGWDTCSCPTPGATTSTSPESAACGDGFCDPDESCHDCPTDCGTCAACTAAPACVGDVAPPGSFAPAPELDLALAPVSRAELTARVAARVASADPGARLVAAALAPARAGEHPVVTGMRDALAQHPAAAAAVRRQLGRVGMSDPAAFAAAFALAATPEYQPLDGSIPEGGSEACGAPKLRVRASAVRVNEEDDDVANDIVFCILAAAAPGGAEVRLTPRTDNLDEGQTFSFGEKGTFWGQIEPRTPDGDLKLTYDCYEEDSSSGYDAILDKLGLASTVAGVVLNLAGGQGWIFSTAGTALALLGEAVALDGDDHLFSATQTIAPDKHMALTNGASWKVHRSGTHLWSDWDWELSVEAWGCAEYGAAK